MPTGAARTGRGDTLPVATPELLVTDVAAAVQYYSDVFGFELVRQDGGFALMRLGEAVVMFDERQDAESQPLDARLNIRVMVDDVDAMHERVQRQGATIVAAIADRREPGLRDFTCLDNNGFALRFASPLR
ncbi:MAG: VOC family protein [Dehalococcoidia bacterium]|nr:VOC family protein [Dehalococcoidia bacterium]